MRLRLLAGILAITTVFDCATEPPNPPAPVSEEENALNTCLYAEMQPGWTFLHDPPPIADELRATIGASNDRPLPGPPNTEFWFAHADGRYLRCTNPLGHAFEREGMPAVCGASWYQFTRAGDSWSVKQSELILCYRKRQG